MPSLTTKGRVLKGAEAQSLKAEVIFKLISETIARASGGDLLSAREVITLVLMCLESQDDCDVVVLPGSAAQYLRDAFSKVLMGQDANAAFNLKKLGRTQQWSYAQKRYAADLMWQLLHQPKSLYAQFCQIERQSKRNRVSVFEAAQKASDILTSMHRSGVIKSGVPSAKLIQKWYYDLKETLDKQHAPANVRVHRSR